MGTCHSTGREESNKNIIKKSTMKKLASFRSRKNSQYLGRYSQTRKRLHHVSQEMQSPYKNEFKKIHKMTKEQKLEKKMKFYFSSYNKSGFNFEEHMKFSSDKDEQVEADSKPNQNQWERIYNLVLHHKWDKFFHNLRKINKNYIANTSEIFERYPRAKTLLYRNLERIKVKIKNKKFFQGKDPDESPFKNINIGRILKRILFQKVVKVKAKQELEHGDDLENRKCDSFEKITERSKNRPDSPDKRACRSRPRNFKSDFNLRNGPIHLKRASQIFLSVPLEWSQTPDFKHHFKNSSPNSKNYIKNLKIPGRIKNRKKLPNSFTKLPKFVSNSSQKLQKFLNSSGVLQNSQSPRPLCAPILPVLGQNRSKEMHYSSAMAAEPLQSCKKRVKKRTRREKKLIKSRLKGVYCASTRMKKMFGKA
ncbi:unnamed protein product [Moneuplotes crassus]|uniref:Uncharacterized protein n=1 Tax=Euplotes crassus TaxID=5936 RepID=A0AAD1UA74_EUPCR|nr:unnamed protein product [Moneuplotes crassus]